MHCVVDKSDCGKVYDEEKLLKIKQELQNIIYSWKIKPKKHESDLILDLIFNHFTPKELLTTSLVNTHFNNTFKECDSFYDKILFKGDSSNLDVLLNTDRQYSHLELMIRNTPWEIFCVDLIVDRFSSLLKTLRVKKFGGFNNVFNKPLEFPYLTELEIHVIGGRVNLTAWSETKNLKKLIVNGVSEEGLMKCLINNSQLEELTIYENSFISYFHKDISQSIKFSLKKLSVLDHYNLTELRLVGEFKAEPWNKRMVKNFRSFLLTQGSLKSLYLDSCEVSNLGKFIMPSIELLEINMLHGDINDLRVPANNVRVFLSDNENAYKIIDLIKHFGALEAIFIKSLSIDMLIGLLQRQEYRLKRFNYTSTYGIQEMKNIDLLCKICIENALCINRSSKENFLEMYYN